MSDFQPWASLPAHIKAQAAPDLLEGKTWSYYGREVENPGTRELRRWLPLPEPIAARSNRDKRKAVIELLKVMPKRTSHREIARRAGVSHTLAAKIARVFRD